MRPSSSQCNDFLAGQLPTGVTFHHNDYVEVISGEHIGHFGSIVSVDSLDEDPMLLVELESKDALIRQSALKFIAAQTWPRDVGV